MDRGKVVLHKIAGSSRYLGLDVGIASCGWAVVDIGDPGNGKFEGAILAVGSWMFDAPEDKEGTPTNQIRRQMRGRRRVIRRRRQRMNDIRALFAKRGLLKNRAKDALHFPRQDPLALRVKALDHMLSPEEMAIALGHIARHRAFKSNKKSDGANAADDSSKMLKAIEATRDRLAAFRTIGEMVQNDAAFAGRRRNRDGDYSHSLLRSDLEAEVRAIFSAQRRLGNALATTELETEFITTAFFQRPLQDSENMVGPCPFEAGEKRAARVAPSFELFRYLSRLAALRLRKGRQERSLTEDEFAAASGRFGSTATVTFKSLRKLICLPSDWGFAGISTEDEKRDVTSRHGEAAYGTAKLRKVLGETGWAVLHRQPDVLDRIAFILTFRDSPERIQVGLAELHLDPLIETALMDGVRAGDFAKFTGAGGISAKACRALIPHLRHGLVYSEACARAGYDHAAQNSITLADIGSPVARKAMSESIKQVKALVLEFGIPDAIHIELARDVGKGKEERDRIKSGIDKRNAEKDRLRAQYLDDIGNEPRNAEDLLRYELWKQQNCRCIYCDDYIDPKHIAAGSNAAQADHILPWSRFGDDSFHNKVLVNAKCNQDKRGRTPFEWFGTDKPVEAWDALTARVEASKAFRGFKKRNLLLKNADEMAGKFRNRNLNDTRYACRALSQFLTEKYPPDPGKRRVFARPGAITSKLRQAWGIQGFKKDADGNRLSDDRHHALDALVCAATTESMLQRLTAAFKAAEDKGLHRELTEMPLPWPGFQDDLREVFPTIFVARAARHRARGKAHDATIKQIVDTVDGREIYERKAIDKVTEKDLVNIKDPERNAPIVANVRAWLAAGKPKDTPPLSPKGDPIRKLRVRNKAKDGVAIRGGLADRGEMARVDVFRRQNARGKWQYFMVPIYPHQIAVEDVPPMRAVQAATDEVDWPLIDETYQFLWPVYSMTLLELVTSNGEILRGYFRGMDRSTGAISLSGDRSRNAITRGIGGRTLTSFQKLIIDRLGRVYEVAPEVRTWRGAACI
ncbi:type II CRISPR RNA-guided endonuclease Cas9 [Dongia sp.]|uniref:type II CRISPR RNA-guided endonuclease Cas9 n=1 Tax=Dongia sp. TaxID=1977262 RepID=UPI0035B4290B